MYRLRVTQFSHELRTDHSRSTDGDVFSDPSEHWKFAKD